MKRRQVEEHIFILLMKLSALVIVFIVILILTSIISRGLSAINLQMIVETPKGGYYLGKEGGFLNAIVGSIYVAGGATLISFIVGIPTVILLNTFLQNNSKLAVLIRLSFDVLWGVPSIVYGAFGFTLMILLGLKASLLAGTMIVSILILPIIIRGVDEMMLTVPEGLIHSSLSLGTTKLETVLHVISKQILPGILSAVFIAFGRAIGDAASVLFTAGYSDSIPRNLNDSVATLPLAIFFQLSSPVKEVQDRAFAAVLVLTGIVLCMSVFSRIITYRYSKYKI